MMTCCYKEVENLDLNVREPNTQDQPPLPCVHVDVLIEERRLGGVNQVVRLRMLRTRYASIFLTSDSNCDIRYYWYLFIGIYLQYKIGFHVRFLIQLCSSAVDKNEVSGSSSMKFFRRVRNMKSVSEISDTIALNRNLSLSLSGSSAQATPNVRVT